MSLTASVALSVLATLEQSLDYNTASYPLSVNLGLAALTNGTGLNQSNEVWADRRTLGAGASETLNMDAPVTRDAVGTALALTKIKALVIKNHGGSTLSASDILKVGGEGSADAWNSIFDGSDTAKTSIQPDGALVLIAPSAAGFAVANAGNYKLKMENTNGAASIDYTIIVIGSQ